MGFGFAPDNRTLIVGNHGDGSVSVIDMQDGRELKRFHAGTAGSLREVLYGPSTDSGGTTNLVGALRKAMATCGYSDLKEFQRVEVVVSS